MFLKKIHEKRKSGKVASRQLNNGGFTLLELIISIAILAVIIMPIMNMFATSYKLNSNARTVQNTNDAASSIAETIRGAVLSDDFKITGVKKTNAASQTFSDEDLEKLANMFSLHASDIIPITKNGDRLAVISSGRLAFQINNYSSGGKKYDAVISIDPNKVADDTDSYNDFLSERNKENVTISQATDYNYSEPRGGAGSPLSEALSKIEIEGGYPAGSVSEISHERSIDVYIYKNTVSTSGGPDVDYLSVRTVYSYVINYSYSYESGGTTISGNSAGPAIVTVKDTNIGLYSEFTDPTKNRFNYYLFFNPDYAGKGLIKDEITIHNTLNIPGNFYVIGQTLPQDEIDEIGYSGSVEVIESHPATSQMYLNVKTNINRSHISGQEGRKISGNFRLINTYSANGTDHFYVPVDLNDKNYNYVATSDAYRIYGYSVSVFLPTGTLHDVSAEKPVYEISGVRLR